MPTKKKSAPATGRKAPAKAKAVAAASDARNTDSAAAAPPPGDVADAAARHAAETQALAAAFAFNPTKPTEYGRDGALEPSPGAIADPPSDTTTASTLSELEPGEKTSEPALPGENRNRGELDRVRADSTGRGLTTNQGVPVADNQHSLKAGLRGPALLKDFILREKLTHFDHERIPERIVHARGSGAHGFFECYEPLTAITRASLFAEAGKRTPVFVRFSTVAGERGSKDTPRDVRGFAVKFYTDEGNWDLVGNNMPVFFIQDAMKFPDLVHAVKPEPHHGMPQAASAHDTFWDFVTLMPESVHMLMWKMSDRAFPRSFRTMQGFGVHTFRLVNADGDAVLVKFHWTPKLGTHSLVWDEAVKISGADPDYNRRDLWEAIEAGEFPEWELGLQVFTEKDAERFSFDVLDATKLVPEELVPVQPVGRMVLNRNPDNFFAETEQVAFCVAHVVPGIDFTNDPLLAGRIHSYVDTQLLRLGGPNFHEIPINAPLAPVHNNQRDGFHRQTINRGRVSYEPNSLGGGCPFQQGMAGYVSFPEPVQDVELRGNPEKFAEHFNQATLFWNSQTDVEKRHIVQAYCFELSKVTVPAIRERMLSLLLNVDEGLAAAVADGIGMPLPEPAPRVLAKPPKPEVRESPALSLFARPGDGGVRTRKVAIFVAPGVDVVAVQALQAALFEAGAVARLVGPRIGPHAPGIDADASFANEPGPLFDAVVVPPGVLEALKTDGRAAEFLKDQFRHCKPILAAGDGVALLEGAGILRDPDDTGLVTSDDWDDDLVDQFITALAQHRHFTREKDPPLV